MPQLLYGFNRSLNPGLTLSFLILSINQQKKNLCLSFACMIGKTNILYEAAFSRELHIFRQEKNIYYKVQSGDDKTEIRIV